jgi:4-hydroxybenzoate polyprenyltransferase
MLTGLTRLWRILIICLRFIRFQAFSFAATLSLLGVVSASPRLTAPRVAVLLAAALTFHIFSHVLNDYIDLPLDRSQRLRQSDPLVSGMVSRSVALWVALVQIPFVLALTALLHPPVAAYLALLAAMLLLALYDIWGKRMSFPPLTDLVQGAGWAVLVLYAALLTATGPTRLTAVVMLYITFEIVLTNGVHGSLRDLANDRASGARTTAILFGARPAPGGLTYSRSLLCYGLVLQSALAATLAIPVALNWFGFATTAIHIVMMALVFALIALGFGFWLLLPWLVRNQPRLFLVAVAHIMLLVFALALPFLPSLSVSLRILVVAALFLPLLTSRRYPANPFASAKAPPMEVSR